MTTQHDERAELIRVLKDEAQYASHPRAKEAMMKAAALLAADGKAGESEEEYFSKRPQIDCNDRRNVFRAGYAAGLSASPAAPAEPQAVDWLPHDDTLRFVQRVLEGDAPKQDRETAARMVRDLRVSIRPAAPAEREPLTDEQAEQLRKQWMYGEDHRYSPFIAGLRAAEAAHHIGKPKDVGINGLTEAETAASASVMGLTSKSKEQEK